MLPGGQLPCHRACQENCSGGSGGLLVSTRQSPVGWQDQKETVRRAGTARKGQRAEDSWKSLGVNMTFMPTSSVYKKEQTSKPARRKWEKGNNSLRGPNCANS